ncbi:hypothetical protein FB451DRAFT_1372016 [Mycena latifolia]|nr:hypothetical protein FB451DRAFT_1372016 [Mycena latifolia]
MTSITWRGGKERGAYGRVRACRIVEDDVSISATSEKQESRECKEKRRVRKGSGGETHPYSARKRRLRTSTHPGSSQFMKVGASNDTRGRWHCTSTPRESCRAWRQWLQSEAFRQNGSRGRWAEELGRASAKGGAGFNVAVDEGASRGRRYRAKFSSRELEEDEWKRGLGLGMERTTQ